MTRQMPRVPGPRPGDTLVDDQRVSVLVALLPGWLPEGEVLLVAPFGPAFVAGVAGEVLAPGAPVAPELSIPVEPVEPVVPVAPLADPDIAAPVPDDPERDCEAASPGVPMLPGPAAFTCELDGDELWPERGCPGREASAERAGLPLRPCAREERFALFFALLVEPAFGPADPDASEEVCAVEDACAGVCATALVPNTSPAAPAIAMMVRFMCALLRPPVFRWGLCARRATGPGSIERPRTSRAAVLRSTRARGGERSYETPSRRPTA